MVFKVSVYPGWLRGRKGMVAVISQSKAAHILRDRRQTAKAGARDKNISFTK